MPCFLQNCKMRYIPYHISFLEVISHSRRIFVLTSYTLYNIVIFMFCPCCTTFSQDINPSLFNPSTINMHTIFTYYSIENTQFCEKVKHWTWKGTRQRYILIQTVFIFFLYQHDFTHSCSGMRTPWDEGGGDCMLQFVHLFISSLQFCHIFLLFSSTITHFFSTTFTSLYVVLHYMLKRSHYAA